VLWGSRKNPPPKKKKKGWTLGGRGNLEEVMNMPSGTKKKKKKAKQWRYK
jgi:hypothetical protein